MSNKRILLIWTLNKNGNVIIKFEAGERGYITKKEITEGIVMTKQIDEGTFTNREMVAIPRQVVIEY